MRRHQSPVSRSHLVALVCYVLTAAASVGYGQTYAVTSTRPWTAGAAWHESVQFDKSGRAYYLGQGIRIHGLDGCLVGYWARSEDAPDGRWHAGEEPYKPSRVPPTCCELGWDLPEHLRPGTLAVGPEAVYLTVVFDSRTSEEAVHQQAGGLRYCWVLKFAAEDDGLRYDGWWGTGYRQEGGQWQQASTGWHSPGGDEVPGPLFGDPALESVYGICIGADRTMYLNCNRVDPTLDRTQRRLVLLRVAADGKPTSTYAFTNDPNTQIPSHMMTGGEGRVYLINFPSAVYILDAGLEPIVCLVPEPGVVDNAAWAEVTRYWGDGLASAPPARSAFVGPDGLLYAVSEGRPRHPLYRLDSTWRKWEFVAELPEKSGRTFLDSDGAGNLYFYDVVKVQGVGRGFINRVSPAE